MKLSLSLFVLVLLGLLTPNLFADPVLTINGGVAADLTVTTNAAGAEVWTYSDTALTVLGGGLLQLDDDTLIATLADVGGVYALNVTDVCLELNVFAPPSACVGFAFSDTALGIPDVLSATGNLAAALDVNVGAAGINLAGVSLGQGSEDIQFNNPPPSVTPEPSALTLFGTGLLGVAGVVKRRFCA